MDVIESGLTWLLLFASAASMAILIKIGLEKLYDRFSLALAAPPLLATFAGVFVVWFCIDPVTFGSSTREPLTFLVAVFAGAVAGVAAYFGSRTVLSSNSITLAFGVAASLGLVAAGFVAGGPTKLVGFMLLVLLGCLGLVVMASPALPEEGRRIIPLVGSGATFVGLVDWLQAFDRMGRILGSSEMGSIASTIWAVVLAVGASCLLFVTMNLLLNHSSKGWDTFSGLAGAALGFIVFGVLDGNRLIQIVGPRETVATELHELVNRGRWTLLIFSTLIGLALGWIYDFMARNIREGGGNNRGLGITIFGVLGAVWGVMFADRIPVDTSIRVIWMATFGAILFGLVGFALSKAKDAQTKTIIGVGGGLIVGLVIGGLIKTIYQPRLETLPLIATPVVLGVVGYGLAQMRGRNPVSGGATGALVGWLIGTFGFSNLGGGPEIETYLSTGVAGALAGLRYGAKPYLDVVGKERFEQKSRSVVFLGPALSFISLGLVIPLVRTIYLSLFERQTTDYIGLGNYRTVFTDPSSFDYTGRLDLFGSRLFQIAAVLLGAAIIGGVIRARKTGNTITWGGTILQTVGVLALLAALLEYVLGRQTAPQAGEVDLVVADLAQGGNWLAIILLAVVGIGLLSVPKLIAGGVSLPKIGIDMDGGMVTSFALGVFFFAFAVFSTLRGTVINNAWWVFTVTLGATGLGLAVAVLADRAKHENVAKSFIFMPLAISFVGAGIIWRFLYIARPVTKTQTGVFNALWVELGQYSTSTGTGFKVSIAILTLLLAAMLVLFIHAFVARAKGVMGSSILLGVLFAFIMFRFTIGDGIGGIAGETAEGKRLEPIILFLTQSQPFNNLWLMIVLIWIQTGFAMVIFSAAIKAVPSEFIEASRVDGATESQIFWKIILPTIAPTVGVIVTTLIVLVMKVFDIVKVMTNGNFDTQVVANDMWQKAFTDRNIGLGSALAIVLFLSVVPVMFYNIRTMQKGLGS